MDRPWPVTIGLPVGRAGARNQLRSAFLPLNPSSVSDSVSVSEAESESESESKAESAFVPKEGCGTDSKHWRQVGQ